MMSTDYEKGFKDGFAAGLEEGKKLSRPQIGLGDYLFGSDDKCPKCGIKTSGVMGYVCSSINCPTFYKTTSYGAVGTYGAVGSDMSTSYAVGANGPSGSVHLDSLGTTDEDIKSSR